MKFLSVMSTSLSAFVVMGVVAIAAPDGVIRNSIAICDPYTPTNCSQPDATGKTPISGTVTATVAGTVAVSNFPATQPVSGTVAVSNFPATQPVSGSVTATIMGTPTVVVSNQVQADVNVVSSVPLDVSAAQVDTLARLNPTTFGAFTSPSAAAEGGRVVLFTPGTVYGLQVTSGITPGYVLVFDATAVPADGAVTPVKCHVLAANSSLDLNYRAIPLRFENGMTVVFSTTGCFTKTISSTAFISAEIWN